MNFTSKYLKDYEKDGLLLLDCFFDSEELKIIQNKISKYLKKGFEGVIFEKDKKTVRGAMGCHLNENFFSRLVSDPRLAAFPKMIFGQDFYVHQFKINFKYALDGARWPWHQDYIYWQREDGMPEPNAISVALFLDSVTEFNGPLTFIKGSHKYNFLELEKNSLEKRDWRSTVGENLKYELNPNILSEICQSESDMYAPKGDAGSVLFFHPLIAHGSSSNLSFKNRRLLIITYNCTSNAPCIESMTRPNFMASRDFSPVLVKEYAKITDWRGID